LQLDMPDDRRGAQVAPRTVAAKPLSGHRRSEDRYMTDQREAHALADQMLDWINGMQEAERAKHDLPLGSPEFVAKAVEVERISKLAFRWAQMQLQVAEQAARRRESGELTGSEPLTNFEPRPLDIVLSHWREAQLRLEVAPLGSPEAQQAVDDIERLREEYQAGFVSHRR
jgi:hypothetical protein